MQFLAIIALIWQRKRVSAALQRAWTWTARAAGSAPGESHRGRATRIGRTAAAQAWRSVDTPSNAARVDRFVQWMRRLAGMEASTGVVRHG